MVGRAEIDPRGKLAAVRQQVGVAEDDPLRRPFGTGGKEDHGRIGRHNAEPAMPPSRDARREEAVKFIDEAKLPAQILQPDDLDGIAELRGQTLELRHFDKPPRGDDGAQARRAAGRQHGVNPGGVVEHRRDPAGRLEREKGDCGADRVRDHQPDRVTPPRRAG
jgi:hypothetical protein